MTIATETDKKLASHILILLRGLKLSGDLDLAEAAIRQERELTEQLKNGAAKPMKSQRRELADA